MGLVLALAAAEVAFRWLREHRAVRAADPLVAVSDDLLGWRYRPGQRVRLRTTELDVEIALDSAGDRVLPANTRRAGDVALFIGDSLTFGWGVEAGTAFPALVGGDLGLRVVDHGVPGYGPDQSYLRLLTEGLPLRPRLVVLTLCDNDLVDVGRARAFGRPKPRFVLEAGRLHYLPAPPPSWLERHSQLLRAMRGRLETRRTEHLDAALAGGRARLIAALVRAAAAASARGGARFVLVRSGEPWQLGMGEGLPGAVVVDAGPLLNAPGPAPSFPRDGHWNERGHRLVACALERRLLASGLAQGTAAACAPAAVAQLD